MLERTSLTFGRAVRFDIKDTRVLHMRQVATCSGSSFSVNHDQTALVLLNFSPVEFSFVTEDGESACNNAPSGS